MTRWDCQTIFELYDRLRKKMWKDEARLWLMTPHPALGDRAPCELIATPAGYERVLRTLKCLEGAETD